MEFDFTNNKRWWIAGAVIFFLSTVLLYSASGSVFNSPDEASAYTVIESFWENGGWYKSAAQVNTPGVKELIYPRSMFVLGDKIVLRGFWGLPVLYSVISWPFTQIGLGGIVFALTPLFALAGLWGLFQVVSRFFDRRYAFWSVVLLSIHPAFWYYTARGMFHNVLLVSLLLIGAGVLVRYKKPWALAVACCSVLLALMIRPSEIWWVGVLSLYWLYKNKKDLNTKSVRNIGVIAVLAVVAYYGVTHTIYGDLGALTAYSDGAESFEKGSLMKWLLPFGFHPRVIWWSVSNWYIKLLAPFTFLAIVGMVQSRYDKRARRWLIIYGAVTAWLFIFYGSWKIFDNPNEHITIGSAYLRYWLPSFVLSAPFMAKAILTFIESFKTRRTLAAGVVLLILGGFSCQQAVIGNDGVMQTHQATQVGQVITDALHTHDGGIADNAVILSDHQDKYLLQDWQVMQPVKNADILLGVRALIEEGVPVYMVTHRRHINEWKDLKDNWFANAGIMYTYWFSVDDFYEVHALRAL